MTILAKYNTKGPALTPVRQAGKVCSGNLLGLVGEYEGLVGEYEGLVGE